MSRTRRTLGSVALIGAGPGDAGLLTVRGAALLAAAEVVVTGPLVSPELLDALGPDVEVIGRDDDPSTAADIVRAVVARARDGRPVARLFAGDPFLLSHGAATAEALAKAKIPFEVVPGVPAATAVPAYAGIPVTAGRAGGGVTVVGLDGDLEQQLDWHELATTDRTVVLLGAGASIGKAAARLVEHGRRGDTPVAVTAWGTTAQQRSVVSTLDHIEADAAAAGVVAPSVTVVGDVVRLRERLSWFESKPLFGWKVLVPRTRAQAGALSAELRALGATPVEVPTIAVEPPRTPAPMERAIKGLVSGRYQWVAFTSTNAVKAVREKLEEVGLDARAFAGVRIAAVGDATADALRAFGIRPDLEPTGEQSSEGLLADWAPYDDVFDPIDRVFLPRADIATETLVAGLKERGWAVDDVTAYRTVRAAPPAAAVRESLKGGGFDAVLFTSSSTVRNLVGIAGKPHESTVLAAIGPQTAATVRELGLRVDVQAPSPSVAELVSALAAFAVERRLAAADSAG
ncbi:MAG: bifunctional uroporphyrinogen-III C-methyltransferase/uroporphyrinogen-III synthase, partial [Actinomycetota bacterium]|nr:bifunctional uroporphyrinogen-III C-methyltransferase/uroporphyrinogen-III synthase [Actinomycetota bacterium]